MTRLRVLRLIARMNVGGPALQVTTLAEHLPRDRFDQRILVGSVGDDEADFLELRAPHVAVVRVPELGRRPRPDRDLRALAAVVREIRAFRPHIVHTHTAKAGVLGRLAARACRVPVTVHTFHGHLLHGYFSPTTTRVVVGVERFLARDTTRLIAVGARVRDDLVEAGIGTLAQYRVVPPGLALPAAPDRTEARHLLGLPETAPTVAFVARMTGVKRPDRFADTALRVAATRPDTVFLVAGDGALLDDLRHRLDPLGERARVLGWRADVERIYAAADVVVLTSDNEGMPVSLIEAAHCGCPAVTTDVGSVREVVIDGETGLVTQASPAALAAALDALLGDGPLRATMGAAARRHAADRFGAPRLASDISAVYEEIARELGLG